MAMEPEESLDYNYVKQTILDKFEINTETYRQRFRSYSVQEGRDSQRASGETEGLVCKMDESQALNQGRD